MNIAKKIDDLIGNTPLLEVVNVQNKFNLQARVLVKIESFNPAGSIKDRAAKYLIDSAEKDGLIKKGGTIIEPTSGNTGIGLAMVGSSRGYRVILTMPETMSEERKKLLKAYGAEVVLTDGKKGMNGAVEKAREIQAKTPNSFIPDQFSNPANKLAHYCTTGPEIWADTNGLVDFLVAGIGTGGTVSGTGKFLKEKNDRIRVVGVEPLSSPLITEGRTGVHKIQGIGANFIPENFDGSVCDKVVAISDEDAYQGARILVENEGVLVGISSGAAFFAALQIAEKLENKGKTIVVILPDTGDRYLSTDLFNK